MSTRVFRLKRHWLAFWVWYIPLAVFSATLTQGLYSAGASRCGSAWQTPNAAKVPCRGLFHGVLTQAPKNTRLRLLFGRKPESNCGKRALFHPYTALFKASTLDRSCRDSPSGPLFLRDEAGKPDIAVLLAAHTATITNPIVTTRTWPLQPNSVGTTCHRRKRRASGHFYSTRKLTLQRCTP